MHFIPGALTLDGVSPEKNRAAAEGEAKIEHTNPRELQRELKIAASLFVLSEVVDLIELAEIKKQSKNNKGGIKEKLLLNLN